MRFYEENKKPVKRIIKNAVDKLSKLSKANEEILQLAYCLS